MSSFTSRHAILGILAAGALVMTGCSSNETPSESSESSASTGSSTQESSGATSEAAQAGGSLIYFEPQEIGCMSIFDGQWNGAGGVMNQMLDRLVYQDGETGELSPWLATEWTINEDATKFTFKLRDDVTFSDGTPLDAEVVKKNFDAYGLGNKELGLNAQENFYGYESSTVVGPHEITVDLSTPYADFLQSVSEIKSGIVAASTIEMSHDDQCDVHNLIGTGPFVLDSIVQGKELVIKRRADYDWAPPAHPHQGPALLEKVEFRSTPEDSIRVGALAAGQGHVARDISEVDEARLEDAGVTVVAPVAAGVSTGFFFRPDNSIFSDERVRRAMQIGFDKDELITTVYSPKYSIATSVLTPNVPTYVDESGSLGFDLDEANRLLDEAGWVKGDDGMRSKDGKPLEFTMFILETFPQAQELHELFAQDLRAIGMKVNLLPRDPGLWAEQVPDPEKVGVYISTMSRATPDTMRALFSSKGRNIMLHEDADFEGMLKELAATVDEADRATMSADIQKYILDKNYMIPLFNTAYSFAYAPGVEGLRFTPSSRPELYGTSLTQ